VQVTCFYLAVLLLSSADSYRQLSPRNPLCILTNVVQMWLPRARIFPAARKEDGKRRSMLKGERESPLKVHILPINTSHHAAFISTCCYHGHIAEPWQCPANWTPAVYTPVYVGNTDSVWFGVQTYCRSFESRLL